MTEAPCTVAALDKNASEEIRIVLDVFKGHNLVDLRVFAAFSAAAVKMPTKKGLSVRVEMIPDLIEGLQQAQQEARERRWIG